tara:strand:+ start:68721 stop:70091 length:1371 start_codon:yes stop_codon:yes gene_type:complete
MSALEQTIPEGYKQTEIGAIPNSWEAIRFGDVVNYIKGYPFKSSEYTDSGIRIVRVSDTSFTSIKNENPIFVSKSSKHKYKKWALKQDDLIFTTVGSKPPMYDSLVGKAILVEDKHDGFLLNQNAVLIKPKLKAKNISHLLLNHFRTDRYINHIEKIYRGNANQASITLDGLFEFKIPLPNDPKEQTAIANALSDVDALLTELENLLAKKQAIKTATMQQLLTGKTRLPQFAIDAEGKKQGQPKGTKPSELGEIPVDWEVQTIGDISTIDPDNLGATTPSDYEFEYISIEQVSGGKLHGTTRVKFQDAPSRARRVLQKGDVLLSTVRPNLKSHLYIRNNVVNLICSTGFSVIRSNNKGLHPELIFHHLFCHIINNQIDMLISGSNYPAINSTDVKNLKVAIGSVEEQIAIATILSDMDNEIQTLEQRLTKSRQIKKGMMQELLTGRTRLPICTEAK